VIKDFFVEISYVNCDYGTLNFTPFRSLGLLEPYWELMELPELEDLF
jgi:hypothetical protein